MNTYLIINGTQILTTKQHSLNDARHHAINICDHSHEIIIRHVTDATLSSVKAIQNVCSELVALKRHDAFCKELSELLSVSNEYASSQYFTYLNTIETNGTGVQMAIRVAIMLKALWELQR